MKKKNIGSSFDSWLREEAIYKETTSAAIKRVLARKTVADQRPHPKPQKPIAPSTD